MKWPKIALAAIIGIIMLSAFSAAAADTIVPYQIYIIQKGDTLLTVGQKFSVPVEQLKTVNNLLSETIMPGQGLWIPPANLAANPYPSADSKGNLSSRFVLGFYVDREGSLPCSYQRMLENSGLINACAPFWYRLAPDNPTEVLEQHYADATSPADLKDIISAAHQNDIQVLALVHNLLYPGQVDGAGLAAQMLATSETRNKFINQLESLIKEYGYDGINLDIERVSLADREKYSLLVKELYQRLDPQGFKVAVCVPAKTRDDITNTWSGPFDYKQIGRYAHYVIIMTYDEHGSYSGPGPIASYGWVSKVAAYAAANIPKEKILLGIPGYGFDWAAQQPPRYISFAQASELAAAQGARIMWDNVGKVPYFKYTDSSRKEHQVWFENASSLSHKLTVVEDLDLGGIAIWRLGMEDPADWKVIGDTF
ncbi:glycosyl hydrolase family 18 protein [Pelotomaculum propionicicum]|uniref:Putative sporulation-specific glycosylase YdhD n=1 Tax=Pelotomaculum propionicicum TaxID=258475 RepID=A0A4Y7RSY3_9FIRM|nr:glycosyl hydrolase family 18 protein [Pelotomaculum propionicicum]TEB11981.1 putative sporulation-specific glycosylase YdhD [Pelotomaculum propionicicum]